MKNKLTVIEVLKTPPAFRNKKWVEVNLKSLKEQTLKCDVILVDYGSSKGRRGWIRKLCRDYGVRLIEVANDTDVFNKSRALNIGLKNAKTEYVLFTDVDCHFDFDFMEKAMRLLEAKSHLFVVTRKAIIDGRGSISAGNWKAYGCCIGAKKEFFTKVNGFDEYYTWWGKEDVDMVDRLVIQGLKMEWINESRVYDRRHEIPNKETLDENNAYHAKNKPLVRNPDGWGKL